MPLIWPTKDPDEVLDYEWIAPIEEGDTLVTATLTQVSGTAALDSQSQTATGLTAFLSGGTDGEVNEYRALAITTGGRTHEETILLPVSISDPGGEFYSQFIAAFPAFAETNPATINYWHAQALLITEPIEACLGARADLAAMLVTAHYLTLQGQGGGGDLGQLAGFSTIKSGTLELVRGSGGATAKMGAWGATTYGAQVYPMLAGCVGGPRVTDTGCVVGGGGFNGYAGPLPPWG